MSWFWGAKTAALRMWGFNIPRGGFVGVVRPLKGNRLPSAWRKV